MTYAAQNRNWSFLIRQGPQEGTNDLARFLREIGERSHDIPTKRLKTYKANARRENIIVRDKKGRVEFYAESEASVYRDLLREQRSKRRAM